jgi:hypothetical protein
MITYFMLAFHDSGDYAYASDGGRFDYLIMH